MISLPPNMNFSTAGGKEVPSAPAAAIPIMPVFRQLQYTTNLLRTQLFYDIVIDISPPLQRGGKEDPGWKTKDLSTV
jgi:hypothetical protein